jgi:hypothetical protein
MMPKLEKDPLTNAVGWAAAVDVAAALRSVLSERVLESVETAILHETHLRLVSQEGAARRAHHLHQWNTETGEFEAANICKAWPRCGECERLDQAAAHAFKRVQSAWDRYMAAYDRQDAKHAAR